MYETLEEKLERHLGPSERVLWSGRPRQDIFLRAIDAFLIPFSIFWFGFVIFIAMTIPAGKQAPYGYLIPVIPMTVMGLYITVGRFCVDAWQRQKLLYAVTTERVVAVYQSGKNDILDRRLAMLSELSLAERSGGCGAVLFGRDSTKRFPGWTGLPGFGDASLDRFDLDADVKNVYEIVRKAQAGKLK